jgi:ABC-type lipoprotein export system ATPase subunit
MKSSTGRPSGDAGANPIVLLRNVVKIYDGLAGKVTALNGIEAKVRRGDFLVITGRSGSGKTTLVNCITGLDRCTSGEIFVAGTAVHLLGPERAAHWRRRNVGVVFQSFELLPTLTALENVMLPMDFAGTYSPRGQRRRAMELLKWWRLPSTRRCRLRIRWGNNSGWRSPAMANDPPIRWPMNRPEAWIP